MGHGHDRMVTVTGLHSRGWTDALVTRFAGDPDVRRVNRHHRSGPKVKLYALGRIEAVERTAEFVTARATATKRQEGARKAAATRRARTDEWLDDLPDPELPDITQVELTARAVAHYNARGPKNPQDDWAPAGPDSAPEFLARITVNYLRHQLTAYEEQMYAAGGRAGAADAREEIRRRVLVAIAVAYPWLAEACESQRRRYAGECRG